MMKHTINLLMAIILSMSSISAKTVEIYPGINKLELHKMSQDLEYYQNQVSFAVSDRGLHPVVSDMTNRYIRSALWRYIQMVTSTKMKYTLQELEDIDKTYKEIDSVLNQLDDPFKIIVSIMAYFVDIDTVKNSDLITIVANSIKVKLTTAIDFSFNELKQNPDPFKAKTLITKAVVDAIMVPLLTVPQIKTFLEKHYVFKALLENAGSIIGDIIYEAYLKLKKQPLTPVLEKSVKLASFEGMWGVVGAFDVYLKSITSIVKLININTALIATQKTQIKAALIAYESRFIIDYIWKYHTNIIEMAKEADLSDQDRAGKYFIENAQGSRQVRAGTFFQLFVIYGIVNGYLDDVDLQDTDNMYLLYKTAQHTLWYIKSLVGGNNKIYVNISDQNSDISIDTKTFVLQKLYWMFPKTMDDKIKNYMTNLHFYGSFYGLLYFEEGTWGEYYLRNPFIKTNYTDISNHKLPYFASKIESMIHINVSYDEAKKVNINKTDYLLLTNVKKIINWNGFLSDIGYDSHFQIHPKEIVEFGDIYIPYYISNIQDKELKRLVDKYVHRDVLNYNVNDMEKYLTKPISADKLYEMCKKEDFAANNVFPANIEDAYLSVQWTSPIRRQQFFQFLVKALNLKVEYYYDYFNNYFNYDLKSQCDTIEGCTLKHFGILSGTNSNGVLTVQQVLFTFENIEKYATKGKEE